MRPRAANASFNRLRAAGTARASLAALCLLAQPTLGAESNDAVQELGRLSLEELANVEVTSVSKSSEALRRAPATIYVITHDDIIRSGAATIPEVLRLAPNLLVTQLTASSFVISARGLGGNPTAQNFANKLLVLIDGRSVYTPLYSGIYSDTLDVMLDDVERIEVISGAGATLWGANAMNGVINIITRAAYLTREEVVDAGGGNEAQLLAARSGTALNDDASLRIYGKGYRHAALDMADGTSAHDAWAKGQGGFRLDWSKDRDTVTVQGDAYRGLENQFDEGDLRIVGANVLSRYQHHSDDSDFQIQGYYDQTERTAPIDGVAFLLRTYDVELQHEFTLGSAQRVIWGGGERVNSYTIRNSLTLLFLPPSRDLTLGNIFIQDTIALASPLNLILGMKLEDDPYSGWAPLPDARLSWQITNRATFWAAASRAIRSPTPFDRDVVEKVGSTVFLGNENQFRPEALNAYEIGFRGQPATSVSFSISGYYNVYDDLRTVEPASDTVFLPLRWGNGLRGDAYGIDAWGDWQVLDWWRLSPGLSTVRKRLSFTSVASGLLGVAQTADDPNSHATLKSSMEGPHHTTFDAALRHVAALPNPISPSYYEMDARVGWQATPAVQVSLSGQNLLHAHHTEFAAPTGETVSRSVMAEVRWKF